MNTKRHRMAADDRRSAILDAATTLLTDQPWEDVTVAGLLDAAGISKGGFYHHFTSKDDVLAEVVLRLSDASISAGEDSLSRCGGTAVERFSAFLAHSARWELSHAAKIAAIVRMAMMEGNGPLFVKLGEESARRCLPLFKALVRDGVAQDAFCVVDTDLTAELLMHIGRMRWPTFLGARRIFADGQRDAAWRMICDRVRVEEGLTNRLLGLESGTVTFPPLTEYWLVLDAEWQNEAP